MEVIDFFATWCGPCRDYSVTVDQAQNEFPNVTFTKINIDTSPDIASMYGVAVLPTTVILHEGNIVGRAEGNLSLGDLVGMIQELGG